MSPGRLAAALVFAAGIALALVAWRSPAIVFSLVAGTAFCG